MQNQYKGTYQLTNIETLYPRKGTLIERKLREYIPVMVLTNMSVFLLSTVDGLVAGNLVGGKALSSINIFFPAIAIITVISALVESGSATSLAGGGNVLYDR